MVECRAKERKKNRKRERGLYRGVDGETKEGSALGKRTIEIQDPYAKHSRESSSEREIEVICVCVRV